MLAIGSLIVVVLVSMLITRVATVALTLTGLSRESARFQARSALSGVGFTTSEAESVVNHPVRRRVVMTLMLVGSAGVVTVVGGLVLGFAGTDPGERELRVAVLAGGLLVIFLLARSATVDRWLSRVIARVLNRWSQIDARDYAALLHVGGEYSVIELSVDDESWMAGRSVRELGLRDQGVLLLGLTRPGGEYLGIPAFADEVAPGDTLVLYGRADRLEALDSQIAPSRSSTSTTRNDATLPNARTAAE